MSVKGCVKRRDGAAVRGERLPSRRKVVRQSVMPIMRRPRLMRMCMQVFRYGPADFNRVHFRPSDQIASAQG